MNLVDFEYFFCVNLLNLKFCTHAINIEMISCQKFHGQIFFINSWEGVKVGSIEVFLIATHVSRFQIFFFVNLLALKLGTCVINIKMMLCQKFHDHMTISNSH